MHELTSYYSQHVRLFCIPLCYMMMMTMIIIIIRHVLGLNRPVSASSNSLFKGLPIRLHPFTL